MSTKKREAYMSQARVARYFGMEPTTLRRLGQQHPLYRAAVQSVPTGQAVSRLGTMMKRFHVEQVKIIERVVLGQMDLETGWLQWQVTRNRVCSAGKEGL